jgi:hypothetical protein
MTNEERVLACLRRIAPVTATTAQTARFAEVQPHQQAFMITQRLLSEGRLRGTLRKIPPPLLVFEGRARQKMSEHYGVELTPGRIRDVPKLCDFTSSDGSVQEMQNSLA